MACAELIKNMLLSFFFNLLLGSSLYHTYLKQMGCSVVAFYISRVFSKRLYFSQNNSSSSFIFSLMSCHYLVSTSSLFLSIQVITRDRVLILAADSRPAMEEWIHSIRTASSISFYEVKFSFDYQKCVLPVSSDKV